MLRSLDDAVSGLQAHETWLDVIGNDVANVDTPGFKAEQVDFATVFAQTLGAGSAPAGGLGGTNPEQIGLGVAVAAISPDQAEGALETTGNPTDLAIQGNGYFVMDMGPQGTGYTRVGDFTFDSAGNMVSKATGFKVLGWMASGGVLPTENAATLQDIVIPTNTLTAPTPTTSVTFSGNLNAATASGSSVTLPVTVYDSLGNAWTLTFTFTPGTTAGTWNWSVTAPAGAGLGGTTSGTITFNGNGTYQTSRGGPITISPKGATPNQTITPDFSALTQYGSATTAYASGQNGAPPGTLTSVSVDASGVITGHFSNGLSQTLAQVAVATFSNPSGLQQIGQSMYVSGPNAGPAVVGPAGTGEAGGIVSGSLEGSNVDLAREFTQMIAAERGFQANAQVVTVDNQILQTLVQLG